MQILSMKMIVLVALTSLLALEVNSQSQGVKVENFPLSEQSPNSCDVIVETHKFEGDCCALNTTTGAGCVLNVVNGRCKISGQYFSLDYTSTFTGGGAQCPPSEYTGLVPTQSPTGSDAPTCSSHLGLLFISALMTGVAALSSF